MRNDLAEIEECCRGLIEETRHLLNWEWDENLRAMLAVVHVSDAREVADNLDRFFHSRWTHLDVYKAPPSIRRISRLLDGIRKSQFLFVTRPEEPFMAYGAWWPWGDGVTISIRVGLVLNGISDHDADLLTEEFIGWFTGESVEKA